jgi:hypothetical protein
LLSPKKKALLKSEGEVDGDGEWDKLTVVKFK